MHGTQSGEIEVNVSAKQAWDLLYGTLELGRVFERESNVIEKVEVIEGDGGPGTILKLTFPGTPGLTYKEKFTKVDHEARVKETEVVEGGLLDIGFTLYRVRLEIIEKSEDWCITKTTIEYECNDEAADMAAPFITIQPMLELMNTAARHLLLIKSKHE